MKAYLFALFGLVLFGSCTKPTFYQLKINDIPARAPNFNTEIRLIEDGVPIKPYFEIIDFDLVKNGALSNREIRKVLELEAIKEGVDAIIEVDSWTESNQEVSFITILIDVLDDDTETTTTTAKYTHIRGKGIMYLENLDFIKDQPEFEYFYTIDLKTDFPIPLFKIEYKLTGQVFTVYPESDQALEVYKKYFQYYSDYHLLKQRERWSYKMKGTLVKKRTLRNQYGAISKKCIPKYNENNRLEQLKIVHFTGKIDVNEFVHYSYYSHGQLLKRTVEIYDGSKVYENYIYDENNQLTGKRIVIIPAGKKPISLHTSIHYYDANYLKDYYFNELVQE